jgi:nitrite reductase (NADH) large subunit
MSVISRRKPRLVLVGNGMAGMRTIEELLKLAPDRYAITVFGAEPHVNYNRILLSSVLAGEKTTDDIVINPRAWYDDNGITLHAGDPVVALDAKAKTVTAASGRVVGYDILLLATGSKPIVPPIPGLNLPGVCAFRDIADVETMIAASQQHRRAVVIGGGLLGLEAAWGLKRRGMAVALVHLMPTLMERQLDAAAGQLLQRDLDGRGIAFYTDGQTEEIFGDRRVEGVRLADGREIPADLAVMAIGIRPEITLARQAGLDANRGIVVADNLRTTDPSIYAVGECAEHRGQCFGLVAPLWDMAKVCAHHLAGGEALLFTPPPVSTRLKITGIDVFSAGALTAADEADDEVTISDSALGTYKKLVLRDNKVVGAVLYGDVSDGAWYFDLMRRGTDIADIRPRIIFGQAAATEAAGRMPAPLAPLAQVAAMADDAQICGCNGVSKGTILAAIADKGLCTLDAVRTHTKASASCGSCSGLVQALLGHALGGEVVEAPAALCKCTELGHDAVRQAIVAQQLKSMPAVMRALGWKTPDGCAKCRPALNYYLLCAWPGEYADDAQSRFVNERLHANIQKDGTYSVVPRMWGGLTSPDELRAIADVAEKYAIPTVKVTGGQRIDLLGVKKEDLPGVWADLGRAGMVSGHAYAKGLRTVKTCVGSEWCRFGTQDSTGLGVKLEKLLWGAWTPHKVKLAVSGCPRNCAEASIKDVGVICTEAGYDILVGGNGGIKVRVTDLLAQVETEAEVLEITAAFLQLYREEAHYVERTAPWLERVGLAYARRRVIEDEDGRQALYQRFLFAQRFAQVDPWAERAAAGDAPAEFRPLAQVG